MVTVNFMVEREHIKEMIFFAFSIIYDQNEQLQYAQNKQNQNTGNYNYCIYHI